MRIFEGLTEFASETSINGIKEIFIKDAVCGLKIAWAIFLIISASLMIRQSISAGVAYSNEATVTNVQVKEVEHEYRGVINICLNVDLLIRTNNFSDIPTEDGLSLGRMYAAAGLMSKIPKLWLQFDRTIESELIDLGRFSEIQVKCDSANITKQFTERIKSAISTLGVTPTFYDNGEIIGINGIQYGTLCFSKQFPSPLIGHGSFVTMNYGKKSRFVQFAAGFYSVFPANPFHDDTDTLHVYSTKAKTLNPTLFQPTELFYDSITKLQLSVQEFLIPNLRRRPCLILDSNIFLPAGRSKAACMQSCLLRLFTSPLNCSFERHLDVTGNKANDTKFCSWFEILRQYRDKLQRQCSEQTDAQDFNGRRNTCAENKTITEWTKKLIDMTIQDLNSNNNNKACDKECNNFKLCREWRVTIDTRTRESLVSETVSSEQIMLVTIAPRMIIIQDIITSYAETLQTTLEALVGNIGGIFGFYFGLSVISLMHIAFFVLHRFFNNRAKMSKLNSSVSRVQVIHMDTLK